jgi:alpha-amylase
LYVDDSLYIMQRTGYEDKPGLIYVLNNRGDSWNGTWVSTRWQNTAFSPVAWWSKTDLNRPGEQRINGNGWGQFYAPPRGFTVYAPR